MSRLAVLLTLGLISSIFAADVITPCVDGELPQYIKAEALVDGVPCTESPCPFPRGSTATASMTFQTLNSVSSIWKGVNATVVGTGITTPFPLPSANKGCDNLQDGSYCPLDKGETPRLNMEMPVLPIYPLVELILKFYLLDENNVQLACMKVSALVVDA